MEILNKIILKDNFRQKREIRNLKKKIRELEEELIRTDEEFAEIKDINYEISSNNEFLLVQNRKYKKKLKEQQEQIVELEKRCKNDIKTTRSKNTRKNTKDNK